MKRLYYMVIVMFTISLVLSSCTAIEADHVNYNMSQQAGYFEIERRITVYNARTDLVIFQAEGYMDISNNETDELVVTCKV